MHRGRLLIAAIIAIVGLVGYYGSRSKNEVTGEVQHIRLTEDQEIASKYPQGVPAGLELGQALPGAHP